MDKRELVISKEEIASIVTRLGDTFTELFKDTKLPPVFVGVMKGAIPFMMDLIRAVRVPVLMDFCQVSSYSGTETTGLIKLKKDLTLDVSGRDVVIVEDIIDSGYTLQWLENYIKTTKKPASVRTVALVDKKERRKVDYNCTYIGKEIPNKFIVGYGLDYNEFFRNEVEIFVPTEAEIAYADSLYPEKK